MSLVSKAFSDIITFSRSSNATRVGPTGLVEYAPHNLMLQSQTFDNASWSNINCNVNENATVAPDGTVTADKVSETAVSSVFLIYQNTANAGVNTLSVYAKAAERSVLALEFASLTPVALFNLSTGSVVSTVDCTASITSIGNGWYRCVMSATLSGDSTSVFSLRNNAGDRSYSGIAGYGLYLWGAQLAVGHYPLDYTPTTSAAVYGPRFDYDPVTLAAKGLLVEEQRSNSITYSDDFNNAAWTKQNASISSNAAAAPDGTTTADKLIPDTSDSAAHRTYATVSTTSGAVTFSCYIKADGYTRAHFTAGANNWVYFNLVAGTVESSLGTGWTAATITAAGNGWYRCTATTSTANVAFYVGCTKDAATNGNSTYSFAGDGTSGILVWGAQLEAGSFATSYIPTLASTVTRSADVASVNTLSPWFNSVEGSLFAEFTSFTATGVAVGGASPVIASLYLDVDNRIQLYRPADTTEAGIAVIALGTAQAALTQSGFTANSSLKLVGGYKANDFGVSFKGATASTDTSGSVPSGLNALHLGWFGLSGQGLLNGHLRRVAYYPRKLTSAELAALTA